MFLPPACEDCGNLTFLVVCVCSREWGDPNTSWDRNPVPFPTSPVPLHHGINSWASTERLSCYGNFGTLFSLVKCGVHTAKRQDINADSHWVLYPFIGLGVGQRKCIIKLTKFVKFFCINTHEDVEKRDQLFKIMFRRCLR